MRQTSCDDRQRKSEKIIAIINDYLQGKETHLRCLDVGCGNGIISNHLANHFSSVIAIDIMIKSILPADSPSLKCKQAIFAEASGQKLPFPDNSYDVVICAQVYEHVDDQDALVSEIYRVIRDGGICFFSGPNRFAFMEEHYWLPFLSWLPHSLASLYMRIFKRGTDYDAYPLNYWQLLKLWHDFEITDYTMKLMRYPEKFFISERVNKYPWIKVIPDWILRILSPLYPNYNWILVKKNNEAR